MGLVSGLSPILQSEFSRDNDGSLAEDDEEAEEAEEEKDIGGCGAASALGAAELWAFAISAVVSKLILLGFGTGFLASPTTPSVEVDLGMTAPLAPLPPFWTLAAVAATPVLITPPTMETFS